MPFSNRKDIVEFATSFAADKHKNQYRNDKKTLYISHLVGVALILQKHNFPTEVIAGAILHDVLEDTDTTPEELHMVFGEKILEMVQAVTYDNSLSYFERKKKYIETVKNGSISSKAISIADKIHNMHNLLNDLEKDISKTWASFGSTKEQKLWFEEEVLKMFKESWDHPLVSEYETLVTKLKTEYF